MRRTAAEDAEIGGAKIAKGQKVCMYYGAANRDPEVFEDPNRFDITRSPNPHLSFGIGEHYCLGANLARMQLRCIFREILTRMPDIGIAGPVRRERGALLDRIKEMPVRFTPESA